ncbi:MAG TPA: acyltransferase family protein [Verrucomicrobiae bacterium]|nr:acyltransferase family protein [Verrucomicrobiae bacterium]
MKHVDFLDQLRGTAILAVLMFHSISTVYGYDVLPWDGWFRGFSVPNSFLWLLPLSVANVGVSIFFVVSGFCIHLSFQQQGRNWPGFFIRRIFRIYPAYLVVLVFFTLLYMHHFRLDLMSGQLWLHFFSHVFLIHNYPAGTIGSINGAFWSMAVEAQLYLIYPVLLILVARSGWRRTLTILAVTEVVIRGADGMMDTLGMTGTLGRDVTWLFSVSPLGFWFSWAMGAALADAFLNGRPLPFAKSPLILWGALALVAYFVKPLFGFRFLLFAVMTAVVLSRRLTRTDTEAGAVSRWSNILKKIGVWSYSIYLLHQPLFNIYLAAIYLVIPAESLSGLAAYGLVVLTWPLVIGLSVLWYNIFEIPGIALGRQIVRKFDGRSAADAGVKKEEASGGFFSFKSNQTWMACALLILATGNLLLGFKLLPADPVANNNLAWSLATNPDASKRNGARAVELAESACQQTQYQEIVMVGTLAAAYAEAGRFEDAITATQRACGLAVKSGDTNLLQNNLALLKWYQSRQPYRVQPGSSIR